MVGIEADISVPGNNISGTSGLATPSVCATTYSDQVEMEGSVRTASATPSTAGSITGPPAMPGPLII
jgi:hypothetical protein